MGATIVDGATVTLVAGGRPRWGEIWAFVDDGGIVAVHRLRGRRRGGRRLSFRGDANSWRDPDVGIERLVGRVTAIVGPDGSLRKVGTGRGPILGGYLVLVRTVTTLVRQVLGRRATARPR
jgi:hypothetical protein